MDSDPELDRLAATIREFTEANVPAFVGGLADQLADVFRLKLAEVGDAEIGAVLMVTANYMNHINDLADDSLGARGVINPLLILGERLYRDGTAEPTTAVREG